MAVLLSFEAQILWTKTPARSYGKFTRSLTRSIRNLQAIIFVVRSPLAGAGERGQLPPSPGQVEPDKASLWMDLFSSDSVM